MKNRDLIRKFWETLFDEHEHTNFAHRVQDKRSMPVFDVDYDSDWYRSLQYYSINTLNPGTDRKIANVCTFRNFLVEFDEITQPDGTKRTLSKREQLEIVKDSKMPWSCVTWSGGKSFHFIVSVEEPFETQAEYDYVSNWIHNIMKLSDSSTKDCCRLTRCPGGTYRNKVTMEPVGPQTLEAVQGRIPNDKLLAWLYSHEDCEPTSRGKTYDSTGTGGIKKSHYIKTEDEAEAHCNEKWPLESGLVEGQGHLMSWARYLVGNTNLKRQEMIDVIARNNYARDQSVGRIERAVDRAIASMESTDD